MEAESIRSRREVRAMLIEPMDDLVISALRISAVSAAQLVIFVVCYEAVVEVYRVKVGEMNKVFGFGMQMNYGLYLLSILAAVHGLAHVLLIRLPHRLIVTVICSAVWILYWGNISDVVPNRFSLLSALGVVSFLVAGVLHARSGKPDLDLDLA